MAVLPVHKYEKYSLSNVQSMANGGRPSPHQCPSPSKGIAVDSNYLKISCHAIHFYFVCRSPDKLDGLWEWVKIGHLHIFLVTDRELLLYSGHLSELLPVWALFEAIPRAPAAHPGAESSQDRISSQGSLFPWNIQEHYLCTSVNLSETGWNADKSG